jgi:hypothetical protein
MKLIELDDILDEMLKEPEFRAAYEEERALLMREIADEEREGVMSRHSESVSASVHA